LSSLPAEASALAISLPKNKVWWLHGLSSALPRRIIALALVFAFELIAISTWLDNEQLAGMGGLTGFVHDWGAWILRCVVGFAAIFVTFSSLRYQAELRQISADLAGTPIQWRFAASHFLAIVVFGGLSPVIYQARLGGVAGQFAVAVWLCAGLAGIALGALAMVPAAYWLRVIRGTGLLWVYSAVAVVLACMVGSSVRWLWIPTARVTYSLVHAMLSPFVSGIISNTATLSLGTERFHVEIAPECSGFEGAGLMLAFGVAWLLLFRKECRFPQALLLVPLGVALVFLLNALRITMLILIGNAGAERIALGGFHSQAGWIGFNLVALGFCVAARRMPWFAKQSAKPAATGRAENPTAAYLLPFVMILAAGMVSRAATGEFEWTYPLRFFVAAGMLWFFRRSYVRLDWGFDWTAPVIGAVVFGIWVGMDGAFSGRAFSGEIADALPTALAAALIPARIGWIAIRALAAVVTVPIAEELAFRGFLIRRCIAEDFEQVSLRRYTWLGLAVSSVIFGVLHGGHVVAGMAAGLLFALALLRKGRIGDAVVAHASANALLSIYVLAFHQWHLW
jgi:exosortase E/protease (VPEID-CTERM system)